MPKNAKNPLKKADFNKVNLLIEKGGDWKKLIRITIVKEQRNNLDRYK